VTGPFQTENSW